MSAVLGCIGCGGTVPPSIGPRPRKWCSDSCRERHRDRSGTCPDCGVKTSMKGRRCTPCAREETWRQWRAMGFAPHSASPQRGALSDDEFVGLVQAGQGVREIARRDGRKHASTYRRAEHLGVTIKRRQPRHHRCRCGESDPAKFSPSDPWLCRPCRVRYSASKWHEARRRALTLLGGKCVVCGWDEFTAGLDVHHVDPEAKDINAAHMWHWKWERLVDELKKCVILCRNCHAGVHAGVVPAPTRPWHEVYEQPPTPLFQRRALEDALT